MADDPTRRLAAANLQQRDQLTPVNQQFFDQAVGALRQSDYPFKDEYDVEVVVQQLLRAINQADAAKAPARDWLKMTPEQLVQQTLAQHGAPFWPSFWQLFGLGVSMFIVVVVFPSLLSPLSLLQPLRLAIQVGLLAIMVALGTVLLRRGTTRAWQNGLLLVVVALGFLLLDAFLGQHLVPVGAFYLPGLGGSAFLIGVAVVMTGLIGWRQRANPSSLLLAVVPYLWIDTILATLTRLPATAVFMTSPAGAAVTLIGFALGLLSLVMRLRQHPATPKA